MKEDDQVAVAAGVHVFDGGSEDIGGLAGVRIVRGDGHEIRVSRQRALRIQYQTRLLPVWNDVSAASALQLHRVASTQQEAEYWLLVTGYWLHRQPWQ